MSRGMDQSRDHLPRKRDGRENVVAAAAVADGGVENVKRTWEEEEA